MVDTSYDCGTNLRHLQNRGEPRTTSIAISAAKPIIAARPFSICSWQGKDNIRVIRQGANSLNYGTGRCSCTGSQANFAEAGWLYDHQVWVWFQHIRQCAVGMLRAAQVDRTCCNK